MNHCWSLWYRHHMTNYAAVTNNPQISIAIKMKL